MDSSIPIDIIENIIDQASDHPPSLRELALTCSQLQPRSRYHLLAWHVCLRNKSQLDDFYAYLRINPHMRPIIRVVTLRIPWDTSKDEALNTQGLLSMIPVPLLTLPNLRRWCILYCCPMIRQYSLGFSREQLLCLQAYTTLITTLDLLRIEFLNVTEFARFLFSFPALRSLRLFVVNVRNDMVGITFDPAKERLAKQLHLTSLRTDERVHHLIMTLLLEIGRSTIEVLTFPAIWRDDVGGERIHDLVCGMQVLRSITMTIEAGYDHSDTEQLLLEAWEIMMKLPTSPPRTHTISINAAGYIAFALAKEPLLEKSRQLEEVLLGQTSHSIVFSAWGTKRRRKPFWTTTLGGYFPQLNQRGRLRVECDESGNKYDTTGHDHSVSCLAVSADSKWIASGSWDTTIILWDARRGTIVREWLAHRGNVGCLAFSPDSRFLASGSSDHSLVIWDVNEGCKQVAALSGHTDIVVDCIWSPDGRLLASGDQQGSVYVWDVQSFTQLHCFDNEDLKRSQSARFSPDGRWLAFLGGEKSYKIWDTTNHRVHKTLHADVMLLRHTSFDPTSRRIIIATEDNTVIMWDIETREKLLVLRRHRRGIWHLAFSPNGDWVLSASSDGIAKFWDSHTGQLLLSFERDPAIIYSACFSPDWGYIALASGNETVRLWRTIDGTCIRSFTEHIGQVSHMLFSPDGETFCTGARDGTVFIRQLRDIIP